MPSSQDQDRYSRKVKGLPGVFKASRREAKLKLPPASGFQGLAMEEKARRQRRQKISFFNRIAIRLLKSRKRYHLDCIEDAWRINDEQSALIHRHKAEMLARRIQEIKGEQEYLWEY